MKRSVSKVAREIASHLEAKPGFRSPSKESLQSWLLLLAPPKPGTRKIRSKGAREERATVKELDALCREVVFLRDKGRCRKCGKSTGLLDWAHVYSRRFKITRWAPLNSMVLCRGCHLWWHQSPAQAVEWWRGDVGAVQAGRLDLMKRAGRCGPHETIRMWLEKERRRLQ